MNEVNLTIARARNREAIKKLEQKACQELHECYQCGKCTAGCLMAPNMDIMPRQIIRLLQLGLLEEALKAKSPWICASCQTCTTRCPHEVKIADVMKAVRLEADRRKIRPVFTVAINTRIFMLPVKWFGRSNEFLMTAFYNIGSGRILQNFRYVPKLITGGKLVFIPDRIKNRKAVRQLMENCKREASKQ
ncbi:MAG: 4Fe-4S dicluster domain-containing protein [Treponema sp.]|nr:4Fe-4S dicluster domain-containing protein [Treponema sp.]